MGVLLPASFLLSEAGASLFWLSLPRRLGVGMLDSKSLLEWRWDASPLSNVVVMMSRNISYLISAGAAAASLVHPTKRKR